MPLVPNAAYLTMAPDWVCEVLSPTTEKVDRADKLPIYAREKVRHAWLANPLHRMLEVFVLEQGRWVNHATYRDDAIVRATPFDAIELDLSILWADFEPG